LELAKKNKAKLLYTSSCEIYGQPEISPQHEKYSGNVDPIGSRSAYEEGKRFGEALIKLYVDKYRINAKIVRLFNTFGPGMSETDQRVIPQLLQSALNGKRIKIYGDGSQTRTHLYIDDLIKALRLVMEKGVSGEAYNAGGRTEITIKELAERILKLTDSKTKISLEPHFIDDHNRRKPSIKKLTSLGWEPKVSLEEGISKMIEIWDKNNSFKVRRVINSS
jgi:nucleoside-diphosphate-sugar epimerase